MIVTNDEEVSWAKHLTESSGNSSSSVFDANLAWSFHTSTENIKLPFVDDPDDDEGSDCDCNHQRRNSDASEHGIDEGEHNVTIPAPVVEDIPVVVENRQEIDTCASSLIEKEIMVAVDITPDECECPTEHESDEGSCDDHGDEKNDKEEGFFRRSIQQKIQYRPCTKNQQCSILRINRNRCQYCRLKKCIAVGMSRDAVRFGRVPKREKAKILAAMQSVAWRSQEKAIDAALAMEDNGMLSAVVGAHRDTCPFTRDRLPTFLMRAHEQAHLHPNTNAPNGHMACPLNPVGVAGDSYACGKGEGESVMLQDFSQRFSPAIRGVVEFAKRLPGFPMLVQEDQVTLLKAGVFEVLLLRLAGLFDSQTNTMVSLNGMVVRRESIGGAGNASGAMFGNARFLMDSMFDFSDRLNALQLSDAELALFSAVVVVSPDRPGLRNPELVERMWSKMTSLLKQVIRRRQRMHKPDGAEGGDLISEEQAQQMYDELVKKIPDLRTLNTLHSEKLLAFKMTEQQAKQEKEVEDGDYRCPSNGNNFVQHRAKWEHEDHQGIGSSNSSTSSGHCSGSSGCASPRSPHSLLGEEGVKSPGGSMCSNESVCSADCQSVSTVASMGGRCPMPRPSEEHRVLPQYHGMTTALGMCMQASAASSTHDHADIYAPRKLDSPTDSGIESGCEAARLGGKLSPSRPTSVCSSPQSREDLAGESSPEDMPVLKRALQAPPLINTNLLMDEAYRPHKKFRAMRREQDGETASSTSSSSPGPSCSPLRRALTPPESESKVHSTLARSLMEAPKMTAEQMKQTDMLTSLIMRGDVPQSYCPYNNGAGPSSAIEAADSSVYSPRAPYGYQPATMAATRVVSTLSTLPTAVPSTSYYPPSPIQPPVHVHPRLSPPSPACPDSPSDALAARLYRDEPMELTREEPMKMEFAQDAQDVVAPLNLSKKIMAIPREPTASRMHVKLEA